VAEGQQEVIAKCPVRGQIMGIKLNWRMEEEKRDGYWSRGLRVAFCILQEPTAWPLCAD
jgi:hypothetical protein